MSRIHGRLGQVLAILLLVCCQGRIDSVADSIIFCFDEESGHEQLAIVGGLLEVVGAVHIVVGVPCVLLGG